MSGLEILRQVRRANEEAAEEDRQREQEAADSNPNGSTTREGIPVDQWRMLPRS